jgi:hypothetical protein
MPNLRGYGVFICHDWEYNRDYYRICDFLDDAEYFRWSNLSVPEHEPLATDESLERNLRNQIRPADVMLVVAGMEAARSAWMKWEINFARRIGTPIVGIRPWGGIQIPNLISRSSRDIVGWNGGSIVSAVRRYAR